MTYLEHIDWHIDENGSLEIRNKLGGTLWYLQKLPATKTLPKGVSIAQTFSEILPVQQEGEGDGENEKSGWAVASFNLDVAREAFMVIMNYLVNDD